MSSTRPLGKLSDFVVEELPQLLVEDRWAIPNRAKAELEGIVDDASLQDAYVKDRELCLLDLKFCEAAIIRTEQSVPTILSETVDFFSGDFNIPSLQYHELVRVNPINDMRTFSGGEVRETEILFYNSHRMVEERLARIINAVEEYFKNSVSNHQLISNYKELMDLTPIAIRFAKLKNMPQGHFPLFRPFISTPCPVRLFDGPSGAYTWRIPYLELMFWGNELPEEHRNLIGEKIDYYSPIGRGFIRQRLAELNELPSIAHLAEQEHRLVPVIEEWIAFMTAFRGMHHKSVEKQLPEALENIISGTSGNTKPGTFLEKRRDSMLELYERLKKRFRKS